MTTNNIVVLDEVTGGTSCNARATTWTLYGNSNFQTDSAWIDDYTDGYRVQSSITPLATTTDTLVGACVEAIEFIDGYADYKNGVPCHAVVTDTSDATRIAAFGHFLFLIPYASWVSTLVHGSATLTGVTKTTIDAGMKLTD